MRRLRETKALAGVVLLLVLALAQLAAPARARAASVTGVVFNNLSLTTALNSNPSSSTDSDDVTVRAGDRLYLGASSDPAKLSGWMSLDDGSTQAFAPGDYQLTTTGDHEYSLSFGSGSLTMSAVQSANVPSMYIRTAGGLANIEAKKGNLDVGGSMALVNADGSLRYNGKLAEMKGRGNTTWSYPKKPYQIKLGTNTELVAGAGSSKTWVLLANYLDQSGIRNEISYNAESAVLQRAGATDFAIKGQMIDLYIDGDFRGSYYLTEKVQVGPTRIDITDTDKLNSAANPGVDTGAAPLVQANVATDPRFAGLTEAQYVDYNTSPANYQQAGYLFELDFARGSRGERSYFITGRGTPITVTVPGDANADELSYAAQYWQDFEDALYAPTGVNSKGKSWTDYIDVASFARYYAVQELIANDDAFKSSTYFYMDKGGKLVASPIWDCDRALGGLKAAPSPSAVHVGSWSRLKPRFIKQLLQQPAFRSAVSDAYTNYVGPEASAIPSTKLAAYATEVNYSMKLNKLRWAASPESVNYPTPAQDVAALRSYLSTRHTTLEALFGSPAYTRNVALPDGIYNVRNGQLVLDVKSASLSNGANVQLYTSNGTKAQQFQVTRGSDGYYSITNINSGKALDVQNAVTASGTNVWQYTPNATTAQRWLIGTLDGTTYTVASALGTPKIATTDGPEQGWVLSATANGTAPGTNVEVATDTAASGQRFTFAAPAVTPPATTGPQTGVPYAIASALDKTKVLDVKSGSAANGANIQIYGANGSAAQRFTLTAGPSGSYVIRTGTGANGVVDLAYSGTAPKTNVWQWGANGSKAQQWILKPTGSADGSYYIVSNLSGLYLDVAGARSVNGTNVQTYTGNSSNAQKFYLIKK